MANTYTKIASVAVGGAGAANIDFTSIPATYTDLCLKLSLRDTRTQIDDYVNLIFNNDSGSNYSMKSVWGTGSTTGNSNYSAQTANYVFQIAAASATASTFSNVEIYVPNYTSSNAKSFSTDGVTETNAATGTDRLDALTASLWSGTATINRITLTPGTGTFVQYSTATLYGIKNS